MQIFLALFAITLVAMFKSSAASRTIAVIGANGKTGYRAVNYASGKGYNVKAVTRAGLNFDPMSSKVKSVLGDVTKKNTIDAVLKDGVDYVIFAASQSKEGGTAAEVDKQGLINVCNSCVENNVKRLVVVSSGAVSKKWSPVFLFLNLFGGIMTAKFEGENAIKKICAESNGATSYTIIRPGGLTVEVAVGAKGVELNQGDEVSGRISREDVAALAVESLDSNDAANTTFECYNKGTGKKLGEVFLSNLFRRSDAQPNGTGLERTGDTYAELFAGLKGGL